MLYRELAGVQWDVIALVETWREAANEAFVTKRGDTWFGSGGTKGRRGTGFLVKAGLDVVGFIAINERLSFIDLVTTTGCLRIIVCYLPHGGYADAQR